MSFQKACDTCKEQILMSNNSGKWAPYNLDNSPHRCINKTVVSVNALKPVQEPGIKTVINDPEPAAAPNPKFNQHRIIFMELTSQEFQDRVNAAQADNDSKGYLHRGLTTIYNPMKDCYVATIHYEIPAENNKG